MLESDAFVIAPDGKLGTWTEILTILNFNNNKWDSPKKICFLDPRNFWKNNLEWMRKINLIPDELPWINFCLTPAEVVDWILK